MKHAGIKFSDVKFVEAELYYNNGRKLYEVEFRAGKREYKYKSNAETGKIEDMIRLMMIRTGKRGHPMCRNTKKKNKVFLHARPVNCDVCVE